MKHFFITATLCAGVSVLVGCQEKKVTTTIITKKPVAISQPAGIQRTGNYDQAIDVDWVGSTYQVVVSRSSDESLPPVTDESGVKYYDNSVTVKVVRQDGSEFFSRKFTKKDFAAYIDESYMSRSVLLGVVFYRAEANDLYFAASVGSPDKLSDDFVPLVVKLNRMGTLAISKDTKLDTNASDADEV